MSLIFHVCFLIVCESVRHSGLCREWHLGKRFLTHDRPCMAAIHCEKHVHVRDPLMDPCRPFLREPFQLPACNYTSNVVINQNLRNPTESIPPATVFLQAAGIDGFDWIWSGLPGFMQIPGNRDFMSKSKY